MQIVQVIKILIAVKNVIKTLKQCLKNDHCQQWNMQSQCNNNNGHEVFALMNLHNQLFHNTLYTTI